MSDETIREILADAIIDRVAPAEPDVSLFFENQPFAQPKGEPWVYITIAVNKETKAAIGQRLYQALGAINFQIQVPENTGTKRAREIADAIKDGLRDRTLAGRDNVGQVTIYCCETKSRGQMNGWWAMNVIVEFRAWFRELN